MYALLKKKVFGFGSCSTKPSKGPGPSKPKPAGGLLVVVVVRGPDASRN